MKKPGRRPRRSPDSPSGIPTKASRRPKTPKSASCYDDAALYIGARLFDDDPQGLARRLSARDNGFDSDWIGIYLDPLHDRLTGAMFRVSSANAQQDMILYNDSWTDSSWDAVWQSAVSVDDKGWTAEIRIPLSQLRFTGASQQTWGINVERYVRRKNESTFLRMVPKNESGLASRMVDLVRHQRPEAGPAPRTAALHRRAHRVHPAAGQQQRAHAVQRRLARLRVSRSRPEVGPHQQPDRHRHDQP